MILWDKPPHSSDRLVCDIPSVGRYLIQRRRKGSREFVLKLNGTSTRYYGTINELKAVVQRITEAAK